MTVRVPEPIRDSPAGPPAGARVLGWSALHRAVPVRYLTLLRFAAFGLLLYVLLSRFYAYVPLAPSEFLSANLGDRWFSKLIWTFPAPGIVTAIHVAAMAACVAGLLGWLVRQAAVVASFTALFLNNLQALATSSDWDVVPVCLALWTLVFVDPELHQRAWPFARGRRTREPRAAVPSFPFVLLVWMFVSLYFVNGAVKLPHWREWVVEPGIFRDAASWNRMNPLLHNWWWWIESLGIPPFVWRFFGAATIGVELTTPVLLIAPRAMWLWWPALAFMHLAVFALLGVSFLLLPALFLVVLLPFWPRFGGSPR